MGNGQKQFDGRVGGNRQEKDEDLEVDKEFYQFVEKPEDDDFGENPFSLTSPTGSESCSENESVDKELGQRDFGQEERLNPFKAA